MRRIDHRNDTKIHQAIAARFAPPEWLTLFEVHDAAGFEMRYRADAVAVNLYPSRGLEIHGLEVKVSRADWLRELKDPEKAIGVSRFCDRWWLAIPDIAIIHPFEVPANWGILVLGEGRLKVVRGAELLGTQRGIDRPWRGFLASLLRNASGMRELTGGESFAESSSDDA